MSSFTVLLQRNCAHFFPGAMKHVCVVKFVVFATKIKTKNLLRQCGGVKAFFL